MKDFFISYNKADKRYAEWIAWQLKEAGYSVVIQAWDFREGSNFVLEMQRAVEESTHTLAVLSPDFLASRFTAPEWAAAFATDPTGQARKLIPVRVRECTPGGLLAQINYIDLVGLKSEDAARERLLKGLAPSGMPDTPPLLPPLGDTTASQSAASVPPWPPALEIIGDVTESLARRGVRMAGTLIVSALLVVIVIRAALPASSEASPSMLYGTAFAWGLVTMALFEAILLFKRRRFARNAGQPGDKP